MYQIVVFLALFMCSAVKAEAEEEIPFVCANHTKPLVDDGGFILNGTDCNSLQCPKDHRCVGDFDQYYCCNKEAEEFYDDLQLCPGEATPYSIELKSTYDKEKSNHFKEIPHAKTCDKLDCPDNFVCRSSNKTSKCCPSTFRSTDFVVSLGIMSQNMTVVRDFCPAGRPASSGGKPLSCGIFFNKNVTEACPKDHVCLEFDDETSKCCPSTGPAGLFASPTCAETRTAVLTFGCGLAVGLSGLADVFANLFNSDSTVTTTIAPKTPTHTNEEIGSRGWIYAGSLNGSIAVEEKTPKAHTKANKKGKKTHISKEAQINARQGGCNHDVIERQLHCMNSLDGSDCPAFELIKQAVVESTAEGCVEPQKMEEKFSAYKCLRDTLNNPTGADCFDGSTEVLRKELDDNFPSGGFSQFCSRLKKDFSCVQTAAKSVCKSGDIPKLFDLIKTDYEVLFAPFLGSGCITGSPAKTPTVAIKSKLFQSAQHTKTA